MSDANQKPLVVNGQVAAILPIRRFHAALGSRSKYFDLLGEQPVLACTLGRLLKVPQIDLIVLSIYEGEQASENQAFDASLKALVKDIEKTTDKKFYLHFTNDFEKDELLAHRTAARSIALNSWRGGISGLNVYDELLPTQPLIDALDTLDPPREKVTEEESDESGKAYHLNSLLLLGADWPFVDSALCEAVLERHLDQPEDMKMVFTQSPPGVCAIALHRSLLTSLDESHAYMGQVMSYTPTKPQPDPIGRDVCVQIPPAVRRIGERLIFDTHISCALMQAVSEVIDIQNMDAVQLASAIEKVKLADEVDQSSDRKRMLKSRRSLDHVEAARLPQQVTLELTTKRHAFGAMTPQFHLDGLLEAREDMPFEMACRVIDQLAVRDDAILRFGGSGEPLLYPRIAELLTYAKDKGIFSIHLETDLISPELLQDEHLHTDVDTDQAQLSDSGAYEAPIKSEDERDAMDTLEEKVQADLNDVKRDLSLMDQLLAWPIDALIARVHADRAATYALTMCSGDQSSPRDDVLTFAARQFKQLVGHLEYLINARNRLRHNWMNGEASEEASRRISLPWMIPVMVRSPWTYADIETFFDRWMHYLGHAVLAPLPSEGTGQFSTERVQARYLALLESEAPFESEVRELVTPAKLPCAMTSGIANMAGKMTVLSHGGVPYCHEDVLGQSTAGHVGEDSLASLWQTCLEDVPLDACLCDGCRNFYGASAPWWQAYSKQHMTAEAVI